ncbi:MAG TPA: hypothetical protein PLN71_01985 [Anaerolineae bacterium]|nr:hypothetical protein [Anaerolineae bacterium]
MHAVNRPAAPAASMPASTPATQVDERVAKLADARTRYEKLASTATLSTVLDQIEDITSKVDRLDKDVATIRARGYRFGRYLEEHTAVLKGRWPQQQSEARRLLQDQRLVLQNAVNEVQRLLGQAEHNYGLLDTLGDRLWALENHVNEAQRSVQGVFDKTEQELNQLQAEVRRVQKLLDALDEASFQLLPGEYGAAVCEAKWISDNQQPEGLLFLTNNRLIFEQREERVIKKKLFSSEKELVKTKLWEAPVGAVAELEIEDKKSGFLGLGRQEILVLRFAERTRELPGDITLQLKGGATNEEWLKMIRRAESGQLAADMFGAPPPQEQMAAAVAAEAAAPRPELPTRCPNCNATLPPIYAGMKQVECAYCGAVINI